MAPRGSGLATVAGLAILALAASAGDVLPPPADQGERHFKLWQAARSERAALVARLEGLLRAQGVAAVLPTHQILRTDERWRRCGAPFVLPPERDWTRIVPTLRAIRAEVLPAVGDVEVVSGFREPAMNRCVGGSGGSAHLRFGALDLRPRRTIATSALRERLCRVFRTEGRRRDLGLGLYRQARFHIDTAGHRTWGPDYTRASSPCAEAGRRT